MSKILVKALPDLKDINIEKYIKDFKKKNKADEEVVRSVFLTYPDDNDLTSILIKVIVLNNRYSAGLTDNKKKDQSGNNIPVDVITMSNHILKNQKNIAKYVSTKDKVSLINKLKKIGDNYITPYSFITKYFSWKYEAMNIYIFDRYVKGLLYYYNQKSEYTTKFIQTDLDDYNDFCRIYDDFFKALSKENPYVFNNTREKDMFLWKYAKSLKSDGINITFE